jgi:signal transduction histidine kinase
MGNKENKLGRFVSIRWKFIIIFSSVFSVVFLGIFFWFSTFLNDLIFDDLYKNLLAVAHFAADNIDGDIHKALYENPDYDASLVWPEGMADERYWEIAQWLYSVHQSNPRAYLYTYVSPEPGIVEFIVSHGAVDDPVGGAEFKARYIPSPPSVILNGLKGETLSTNMIQDEWGTWVSGFVPIYDSSNQIVAAVGVDYQATDIIELQNKIKSMVIPSFSITYLIMVTLVGVISNRITTPLIALSKRAAQIGDGHYELVETKKFSLQDEVSTLSKVFNHMVEQVRLRENKLKELAARLHLLYQANIDREEKERKALALDIHDDILNQLAILSTKPDSIESPEFQEIYQFLTARLRQMTTTLRPAMLNYGLKFALEEYVGEFSDRSDHQPNIILEITSTNLRYDTKVEEHHYRIVQQACENALLHAQAKNIWVNGCLEPDQIELTVKDDGIGFELVHLDFNSLLINKHYGLAGMYERAVLIGAKLEITTKPGVGSQVSVSWHELNPLQQL